LNQYQKLGGQAVVYGLGNIVPRLINYAVLTFYYTRRFTIEEYGIITELHAYVAVFLVLLTYGMETGLFKFSAGENRRSIVYSTALISLIASSLLFLILILFYRRCISTWTGYGANPEYIVYLGFTLAFDAVAAIVFAKLRIENKVRKFVIFKIINVVLTIFFVFLFLEILPSFKVLSEQDWYVLYFKNIEVGYVFIANVMASLIVLGLLLWDMRTVKLRFDMVLLKSMLIYSIPLLISGLAGIFNETIDRILMRRLLPENVNALYELGIYGANYRIAVLMTIFIQMFRYAAEPFFFNLSKEKDARSIYANVLKYFTIFSMVIFLTVSLGIDFFKYFIDRKYFEGLDIVPVVLAANVLIGILFNVNMWYKLSGKTIYGVYITGIGALIAVILNFVLIPHFSYRACAWIHVLSNLTMVLLTYYIGQKIYKIEYDMKKILLYIGLALGLFFLGLVLRSGNEFLNNCIAVVFVLVYLIYCDRKENLRKIFFSKNEG
jgi:O-antigen/teichoic acid export membrane protein